ncbi:MAG: DUF2029 domain-containing protein [Acidimicrobiaceae bacterium]|nr:DUF2029 domain-containing protein [Acidimicrobiaceae bacterium]
MSTPRPFYGLTASGRKPMVLMFVAGLPVYIWYFSGRVNQSDFLVFYSAALGVTHHLSPYPAIGTSAVYSGSSFVYPYLSAYLFIPFTFLSRSQAEHVYVIVSLASIMCSLWLLGLRRICGYSMFLIASTTIVSWQMGTLNPLFMLCIALAWKYRHKAMLVGVLIALVGFAKLFLVPLVLWMLISRRYYAFLISIFTLLILAVTSTVLSPLPLFSYLRLLLELSRHEGASGFSTLQLISSLGFSLHESEFIVAITALLFVIFVYQRHRATNSEAPVLAGVVALSLIITPILWSSYLLLLAVIIILIVPVDWAGIVYAALSWFIVTPDRAGFAGVTLLLFFAAFNSLALVRVNLFQPSCRDMVRTKMRLSAASPVVVGFLAVAAAILLATALSDFKLQPTVDLQMFLLFLLPMAMMSNFGPIRPRLTSDPPDKICRNH